MRRSLDGKTEAIYVSVTTPGSGRSGASSVDSTGTGISVAGAISPQIMKLFSPKKKLCTMDCDYCRSFAKQQREEQNNRLGVPSPSRRNSTPWFSAPSNVKSQSNLLDVPATARRNSTTWSSAPCSRKSSCVGSEMSGTIYRV